MKLKLIALTSLMVVLAFHQPSDASPKFFQAIASCMPDTSESFKEVDQVIHNGVTHVLVQVGEKAYPWYTVPELNNGKCTNYYTRNEADFQFTKSPDAVAQRFAALVKKEREKQWNLEQVKLRQSAKERGIPFQGLGLD